MFRMAASGMDGLRLAVPASVALTEMTIPGVSSIGRGTLANLYAC